MLHQSAQGMSSSRSVYIWTFNHKSLLIPRLQGSALAETSSSVNLLSPNHIMLSNMLTTNYPCQYTIHPYMPNIKRIHELSCLYTSLRYFSTINGHSSSCHTNVFLCTQNIESSNCCSKLLVVILMQISCSFIYITVSFCWPSNAWTLECQASIIEPHLHFLNLCME